MRRSGHCCRFRCLRWCPGDDAALDLCFMHYSSDGVIGEVSIADVSRDDICGGDVSCDNVGSQGPEVRSGDLAEPIECRLGDRYTFTIVEGCNGADNRISVNYDDFITDVEVDDIILVGPRGACALDCSKRYRLHSKRCTLIGATCSFVAGCYWL